MSATLSAFCAGKFHYDLRKLLTLFATSKDSAVRFPSSVKIGVSSIAFIAPATAIEEATIFFSS